MKTRYVAFIIRIRVSESEPGLRGVLQQAGDPAARPFNTFERLVDLLRGAIAGLEPEKRDGSNDTGAP